MDETTWLIIGIAIGIPLGILIYGVIVRPQPASVVFDRDSEGRILGIHYVPMGGVKTVGS